jgi:glycerol-3-phosphate dehydrogenase subunit B
MGSHPISATEKDLVVIGTGMTGMAAALFAARQGFDTAQVGIMGQINFASGLIDLLGVHPVGTGRIRSDPWTALGELAADEPGHPYARLTQDQIRLALETVFDFLASARLPYHCEGAANQFVLTPVGTSKVTFALPRTMAPGVRVMADRKPCLIIDFKGLKGFSAAQIAGRLKDRWTGLRAARVRIPGTRGEINTENFARSLEPEQNRRELAAAIKPCLKDESALGVPAILGVHRTGQIVADLERWLGVEVFEIPTMLPAVTGLRLRESFESGLRSLGVQFFHQHKVEAVSRRSDGSWLLTVGDGDVKNYLGAKCVILASGRFLGNGLYADRTRIRETIFDLPVRQPAGRSHWHRKDLLHLKGHPVNRAGLATDMHFRPAGSSGMPLHDNLFAAGSILADQDWMRQKCGSGLAIATAFGAVRGAAATITQGDAEK